MNKGAPADTFVETEILDAEVLCEGFRGMTRYKARHRRFDGEWSRIETRDLHNGGGVVAVIAVDPARNTLILIRQYRLAAHLAGGNGGLLEVVAGGLEEGEDAAGAARRELEEETSLKAQSLRHCFDFMASPGITTERTSVFLAHVDARDLPERAGSDDGEDIVPVAMRLDEALTLLDEGRVLNGFAQLCILWLARQGETPGG